MKMTTTTTAVTQMFALVSLFSPIFASAASLNCSGDETKLSIEGSLGVGQTIHASFVDSDVAFGQTADINCQVEQTPSGIYCVDDQPGVNYVLTLTDISSAKRVVLTEQGHGGYGSQSFDFPMTCRN